MGEQVNLHLLWILCGYVLAAGILVSPVTAYELKDLQILESKPRVLWSGTDWQIYGSSQNIAFKQCMAEMEVQVCEESRRNSSFLYGEISFYQTRCYSEISAINTQLQTGMWTLTPEQKTELQNRRDTKQKECDEKIRGLKEGMPGADACKQDTQKIVREQNVNAVGTLGRFLFMSEEGEGHLNAKADRCRMLGQSAHDAYDMAIEKTGDEDFEKKAALWQNAAEIYSTMGDTAGQQQAINRSQEYLDAARERDLLKALFEPLPPWVPVAAILGALFILHKRRMAGR